MRRPLNDRLNELLATAPQSTKPIEIPDCGRDDLAQLFADRGLIKVVEVGVERGVFAETLCKANPGIQYFGVDPWQRQAGYRDHVGQEKLDGFYDEASARLAALGRPSTLLRHTSEYASALFDDGELDAVYLDANHDLINVVLDIHRWRPKVRKGGIIAGHDWARRKGVPHHVIEATCAYTQAYGISPWFVLGRKARIEGEVRDKSRSWMWVN